LLLLGGKRQVFEENKKVLAFVTERVVCSLADFHSRFEGIPADRVASELRQMRFTEMEVGRGLYNIGEVSAKLCMSLRSFRRCVS
jgi:hypothetical protein